MKNSEERTIGAKNLKVLYGRPKSAAEDQRIVKCENGELRQRIEARFQYARVKKNQHTTNRPQEGNSTKNHASESSDIEVIEKYGDSRLLTRFIRRASKTRRFRYIVKLWDARKTKIKGVVYLTPRSASRENLQKLQAVKVHAEAEKAPRIIIDGKATLKTPREQIFEDHRRVGIQSENHALIIEELERENREETPASIKHSKKRGRASKNEIYQKAKQLGLSNEELIQLVKEASKSS